MTKADLACYRTNYDRKVWEEYADNSVVALPLGVLDAIAALCDEVERLHRRKRAVGKR